MSFASLSYLRDPNVLLRLQLTRLRTEELKRAYDATREPKLQEHWQLCSNVRERHLLWNYTSFHLQKAVRPREVPLSITRTE